MGYDIGDAESACVAYTGGFGYSVFPSTATFLLFSFFGRTEEPCKVGAWGVMAREEGCQKNSKVDPG
jgi:hypothetical protein